MKLPAKILLVLGFVLLAAQAIRPERNLGATGGPNHISQMIAVPAGVETLLAQACYDCHSNATQYPWYANVQPLGWWLQAHVKDGKRHLNFSEFATYGPKRAARKLEEVAEEVRKQKMPLASYTWVHGDARLSAIDREALADWATSTRRALLVAGEGR